MGEMLLSAERIRMYYGDREILNIPKLQIYDGQRIGLVGENGAGKSTLLRILNGDLAADEGRIRRFCPIAFIRQHGDTDQTVDAETGARFRTKDAADYLSGGEKTRRRAAAAFSRKTPLLFADEPSTDLDEQGNTELRSYLLGHQGAMILISHDRELLDLCCTQIWYLENGRLTCFEGNYSVFRDELEMRRERQMFEYDQYRREKRRLEASAQRLQEMAGQVKKAPSRMGNSEARLHTREATDAILQLSHSKATIQGRIDRLEKKERPKDLPDIRMSRDEKTRIISKNAITVNDLSLFAGERTLLRETSFSVLTDEHTALIGENGCGKSTLIRAITGGCFSEGIRREGSIRVHDAAVIGLFDQDHVQTLDENKSALENAMYTSVQTEGMTRIVFARMNMRGDEVFKPVRVLSGGEKVKTALVKLLVSDANVLILDEPTNHLDVFTIEALEELLKELKGTLLLVSHDNAFVSAVATRVLRIRDERVVTYECPFSQIERDEKQKEKPDSVNLEITALEMRLAELAARLSAPKKGDDPQKLNEEMEMLITNIRNLKQKR